MPHLNRRYFLGSLAGVGLAAALARAEPRLPVFKDITAASGIDFQCNGSPTSEKYLIETMPGGVAMFDYDGDGRLDLYFVNGAKLDDPMPAGQLPDKSDPKFWNRLYHNNGDGTFTDVTRKAGVQGHSYGMGVAAGTTTTTDVPTSTSPISDETSSTTTMVTEPLPTWPQKPVSRAEAGRRARVSSIMTGTDGSI